MKIQSPLMHRSLLEAVALLYRMLQGSARHRLGDADERNVCLTVSDLVVLGYPYHIDTSLESVEVCEDRDSVTVAYSYKEPWIAERAALLLHVRAERTPSPRRALQRYGELRSKLSAGDWLEGAQRLEPAEITKGDSTGLLSALVKNGKAVGSEFLFSYRTAVLYGILLGPHFDNVNEWCDLMTAKAQRLHALPLRAGT